MSALVFEDFSYTYAGAERPALREVSLRVEPGEFVVLAGLSASGKSTLLRAACGLVAATAGTVRCASSPALGVADERSFHWRLTVAENLRLFADLQGADRLAIPGALARVGLAERAETPVRACSSGMRARLGLARALLRAPDVLLLDEVERGLDPAGRHVLAEILAERRAGGGATLVATHDTAHPERFTRALLLDAGRLVHDGEPAEAFARLEGRPS